MQSGEVLNWDNLPKGEGTEQDFEPMLAPMVKCAVYMSGASHSQFAPGVAKWRGSESVKVWQNKREGLVESLSLILAHRTGFEPAAPSVGGLCSIQLSYRCIQVVL